MSKISDPEIQPVSGLEDVFVRTISGRDYKRFQAACRKLADLPEEERNVEAVYLLVNLTACSADGRRLFMDDRQDLTEEISITKARRIYDSAVELNRLTEKKVES